MTNSNVDSNSIAETAQMSASATEAVGNVAMGTYILFAVGAITGGLTAIIGVIVAYLKRGDAAGTIYESHFTWLIRSFWIGLALSLIGVITAFFGVGVLVLVATAIWIIYRWVKGFLAFNDRKPIVNPSTFF